MSEDDQRIVGFVGATPGEITLLFVLPEVARSGLGTKLLEFGLRKAQASFDGPLTVVATKNSQSFYERHGFEATGEQAFLRGAEQLSFPVVKMLRRSTAKNTTAS